MALLDDAARQMDWQGTAAAPRDDASDPIPLRDAETTRADELLRRLERHSRVASQKSSLATRLERHSSLASNATRAIGMHRP